MYIYIYIYILVKIEDAPLRFLGALGRFSQFFSGLQNGTRKAAQTGRRRTLKTYGKSIP